MARWTPVVIEGGKSNPNADGDLLRAFADAGFITDSDTFDYEAIFKALEANKPAVPSRIDVPFLEIFTDEFGEQHFRFF